MKRIKRVRFRCPQCEGKGYEEVNLDGGWQIVKHHRRNRRRVVRSAMPCRIFVRPDATDGKPTALTVEEALDRFAEAVGMTGGMGREVLLRADPLSLLPLPTPFLVAAGVRRKYRRTGPLSSLPNPPVQPRILIDGPVSRADLTAANTRAREWIESAVRMGAALKRLRPMMSVGTREVAELERTRIAQFLAEWERFDAELVRRGIDLTDAGLRRLAAELKRREEPAGP